MGNSSNNAMDYASDKLRQGKITVAEANVLMIQIEGVRVIRGRIPREVRNALNEAVKNGKLGHLKREGLKPECYFHKNSKYRAIEMRNNEAREAINILKKVYI